LARLALNDAFGEDTWIVGEVNGYKLHDRSGHAYFDLVEKDTANPGQYVAKIGCAFFRGAHQAWLSRLRRQGMTSFSLADGIEVKIRAGVDIFIKEGRYQLIVSDIDAAYSLGAIAKKRQQTIDDLKRLGLIDKNRNTILSECPLNIGLITSMGSAAYNDFLSVLKASGFAFRLTVFDAYTQGERTVIDVARGIATLEARGLDAIAIVRGGGSKTDLFYFDDFEICRAIANCRIPVLTGIGHEIDMSVADMVAHSHFVTPTDAAKFLASVLEMFWQRIDDCTSAAQISIRSILEREGDRLKMLSYKLSASVSRIAKDAEASLHVMIRNLGIATAEIYSQAAGRLAVAGTTVYHAAAAILKSEVMRLDEYEKRLQIIDPASTLKRGFSITTGPDGRPLLNTTSINKGDNLRTVLSAGSISSIVESKE
jgi:exodeoxyribonuclease VII large subunit